MRIKGQYLKISKGEIGRLKELWRDTPNIDNCEHCVDIETNGEQIDQLNIGSKGGKGCLKSIA